MASALSKSLYDLLLVIIFSVMVISGTRSEVTNAYEREEDEDSEDLLQMIQIAIEERNEAILSLANENSEDGMMIKSILLSWRDDEGNTILHLAAKKAPPHILGSTPGGAVFRLQQDLKWFKKVKSIEPNGLWSIIQNRNKETALRIFRKEHQDLMEEGKALIRSTARWFLQADGLIAFTVIRSILIRTLYLLYNTSTDTGIVRHRFVECIALWLTSTSYFTSVFMFHNLIRTSFYEEKDFLNLLSQKLVTGIATLIFTLAMTMVIASAAELCVWEYVGVAFAVIPLRLAFSQLKLLRQMFSSTNGQRRTGLNISHDQYELLRVFRRNYRKYYKGH